MHPNHEMTVAITGELGMPRAEYVRLLSTVQNVRFVTKVAGDTDYLVAGRFDTAKARKAAISGTTIISENELKEFLKVGKFPFRSHRNTFVSNWPDITWTELVEAPELWFLKYHGGTSDEDSFRFVYILKYGHSQQGHEYFEAFDGLALKTYRRDRITALERVKEATATKL